MPTKLLTFILCFITSLTINAATVRGIVNDVAGDGLPNATVNLLSARDSSYVKGVATNLNGRFALSGVRSGKYILSVSYLGYNPNYTDVTVGSADVKLPAITLVESSVMLKEATVVGVKTPIKVMEDTVEYNADTYKTQPNAVVEDLLKRLPGVEVGSDGKITANGKEVTKILVDGKEFFSDDPKVASKNLPVNMVDKLQVVDRKSDLARITGVDDGEDETVINLTVKKGMKNGWFGAAEAGYGTDDRYQVSYNINRFWNDNQITFIGKANNTNDLGFTDGNGNRFRRFGGDRGINTSQSFGVNFNVGNKEIFRVGGNVLYSHTDQDTRKLQNRQYLFPDSVSYTESGSKTRDKGHNVRADFRMEWKPDSLNTFDFRPRFSFNQNNSTSIDSTLTMAGDPMRSLVNRSFNTGNSEGTSWEFSGNLIYNRNSKFRKGRSFSLNARYQFSDVNEDENTYSHNRFYLLKDYLNNDSIDVYDQYSDNHTWSNYVQARLSWTEPLGNVKNGRFLTFSYRMSYKWNNADKMTYDRAVTFPDGVDGNPFISQELQFVDSLSDQFRNHFFNQDIRLGFKQVKPNYTLDAGISLVPSMSESRNLLNSAKNIDSRWVWNVAPFLRYRYKFSKTRSLMVNYRSRSSQPSMTQLQPVIDYSNPLRVVVGNPNLDPTFTHYMRMRFQDFNPENQRSIMLMADASIAQNSIVSRTSYNPETGGQTTTYDNVNGVWSLRVMNMVSMPLRNKAFTFSNHFFGMLNHNVGFNNGLRNTSSGLNESQGLAWRPDNVELEIRPYYNLQQTWNTQSSSSTLHRYGGYFNGTYYTPFGIVLASDVSYNGSSGYASGFDSNYWIWNASVSYQFLKDKSATIAVKVYDLLQQKSSVTRTVTANYLDDTYYNSLNRYFMLTFTYKFNTFGKGNEPASRTGRRYGPPHGAPPPR